jgi:hypothetical protein
MKHILASLIAVTLAACGGGSVYEDEAPAPVPVQSIPAVEPACAKPGELVVVGPMPACKVE